ncbi:hypothetical protein PHMEG_00018359 [Phytophthora megakarya]|uniref:Uncharacterized protein n=1 Tax=Phytophthora megakarya TaxID=4795 RepID=A0A225VUJ4_9STRA|nr:hypothetical protein PHMEG_00018359 [Phytophthora megakarya]
MAHQALSDFEPSPRPETIELTDRCPSGAYCSSYCDHFSNFSNFSAPRGQSPASTAHVVPALSVTETRLAEMLDPQRQQTLSQVSAHIENCFAGVCRFAGELSWGPEVRGQRPFIQRLRGAATLEDLVAVPQYSGVPLPGSSVHELRENAEMFAKEASAEQEAPLTETKRATCRDLKTTREVFKRKFVEYKSSFDRLNALLPLADPEETPLTQKIRARVRELVAENKRLQKTASSLRSLIRLDEIDSETLIWMLEGLEAEELDWEIIEPNPLTRKASRQEYKLCRDDHDDFSLANEIARSKFKFDEIQVQTHRMAVAQAAAEGKPEPPPPPHVVCEHSFAELTSGIQVSIATNIQRQVEPCVSLAAHYPYCDGPAGPSRKRKATRSQHGDDDRDVNLGGGSEDVDMEGGRECSATPSSVSAGSSPPKKQHALHLPHGVTVTPPAKSKLVTPPVGDTSVSVPTKADPTTPFQVQSSVDSSTESGGSFRSRVDHYLERLWMNLQSLRLQRNLLVMLVRLTRRCRNWLSLSTTRRILIPTSTLILILRLQMTTQPKELAKIKPETECLDDHGDSDSSVEDDPPMAAPTKSPAPVEAKVPSPKPLPATSGKKRNLKHKKTPVVKAEKPAVKIHPPKTRVISRGSSVDVSGLPSLILGKSDLVKLFKRSTTKLHIDPSWNIAFRGDLEEGDLEEGEEEEGQVTAKVEHSLASAIPGSPALSSASNETMDLDQGADADTSLDGTRGAEMLAQLGETVDL